MAEAAWIPKILRAYQNPPVLLEKSESVIIVPRAWIMKNAPLGPAEWDFLIHAPQKRSALQLNTWAQPHAAHVLTARPEKGDLERNYSGRGGI